MKIDIKVMKALSIAQPWAECIISKGKNVENRSWNTKQRGYLLIHACVSYSAERFEYCNKEYKLKLKREELPFGKIVGIAEISDVITRKDVTYKTKKWFGGEFGFVLKNVIMFDEPVNAKGSLGFWKVRGKTLKLCLEQLSNKQKIIISKALLESENQ